MKKNLVNGTYLLEKYPGKGGWTYIALPQIKPAKDTPFGWVKVSGSIDDYSLKQISLMSMGERKLFLPVKASIRKQIKKEAGDFVELLLFEDNAPIEFPKEILDCFDLEPTELLQRFKGFALWEQKAYLNWIYDAKKKETKAKRIAEMMRRIQLNLKLHDKLP